MTPKALCVIRDSSDSVATVRTRNAAFEVLVLVNLNLVSKLQCLERWVGESNEVLTGGGSCHMCWREQRLGCDQGGHEGGEEVGNNLLPMSRFYIYMFDRYIYSSMFDITLLSTDRFFIKGFRLPRQFYMNSLRPNSVHKHILDWRSCFLSILSRLSHFETTWNERHREKVLNSSFHQMDEKKKKNESNFKK